MIRLLAVVDDAGAAVEALSAITDCELNVVRGGRTACIGTAWTEPLPRPDPEALRTHDRLIQALMPACTVVPFRFSTLVSEDANLEAWLRERDEVLGECMSWLRHRVELAFRAWRSGEPDPGVGEVTSGRDYLRSLARKDAASQDLVDMHAVLSKEAVASGVLRRDPTSISAAYLVDASEVAEFRARAEQTAAEHSPSVSHSLTGPWAPYSFVTRISSPEEDPGPSDQMEVMW